MQKRMFEIKCTDCGKTATVPFKPTVGKPVYCRACFPKHMLKRSDSVGTDPKQTWARRRDNYEGRKEERPASVFQH